MIKVEDWDEQILGNLDLESVRRLYQPVYHFRVQLDHYHALTSFSSTGVARAYYVLSGTMKIDDGNSTHVLGARQYILLPKGSHTICCSEKVDIIRALELPEQVWAHEKKLYETGFRPRLQKIDYREH